jgi:hypothetical protein
MKLSTQVLIGWTICMIIGCTLIWDLFHSGALAGGALLSVFTVTASFILGILYKTVIKQ